MKKHKTTLITGGTSGIGLAIAKKLAREGHDLVLIGSNPARDYDAARRDVEEAGEEAGYRRSVLTWGVDITDFRAVKQMMRQLSETTGMFDSLVHSAGVFFSTPVAGDGPEDFARMMAVNVQGMWNIVQAALPFMKKKEALAATSSDSSSAGKRAYIPHPAKPLKEQTGAKIVAISSICAFYSFATYSGYSASKAAVTALVRALALELGPLGININAVEPGRVETAMHHALINDAAQEAALRAIAEANPSRRAFSSPDDIANVVHFLLSEQATALHGASIVVDEGTSLGV